MHLKELITQFQQRPSQTVPNWVIGCFKRKSISFSSGLTDISTHVLWLQGRNITIDLRLPIESDQITNGSWQDCNEDERYQLANYEGWFAYSDWQDEVLSWSGGTAFQIHNRWPQPATLTRVGNCMMEFSPTDAYIEEWRLRSSSTGPLVSLELIEETNLDTGECRHRGGALIINGDWAGIVLGRAKEITDETETGQLRELVKHVKIDDPVNHDIFNFETSVAQGSLEEGYTVKFTTVEGRKNQTLFELEGFEFDSSTEQVIQLFKEHGQTIERRFSIDTLEPTFNYSNVTETTAESERWVEKESETMGRYLVTIE